MADLPYNVLFLCTGNSARSIMAEVILNKIGAEKFRAFSAGSQPKGCLHPETLRLLKSLNYNIFDFRSKSWVEFVGPTAPELNHGLRQCCSGSLSRVAGPTHDGALGHSRSCRGNR